MPHQKLAVEDAYAMAGVGSKNIDVCQFYDNFTSSVLVWFEHAGSFVENGRIRLGG